MDLWVVAAAAGAGYVAKNLQNLTVDKKESVGGSSSKYSSNVQSEPMNFLQQLREKTCPLRRLAQKRAQDDAFLKLDNHSDIEFSENDGISKRDAAASTIAEESLKFEDDETRNFSRGNRGKIVRSRRSRVNPTRPINSLGSLLDSQLCKEHENMEGNTFLYSSMSTVRPVLVADGSRIISKSGSESSLTQFECCNEEERRENYASMEQFESLEELQRKQKKCSGHDLMILFIVGMTVGILSATRSWKNEVDKLNKQLKQMQNLVQDLHEELDMKEMVMVKELNTPLSIQEHASPSDMKANNLSIFDSLKENDKNVENLELLSKIEAELQAELEMLEHNMKASAVDRISSVVELGSDSEPDIVEGDLKPILSNGTSESENETTDTSTNSSKPANYAVSPWELSLRLHELIESRLETRVKELEEALGDSQNRVQFLGSQNIVPGTRLSYSETDFSSADHSPKYINLSGDYVDEYKESNGILLRVTDRDQEKEDGEYRSVDLVQVMPQWDSEDEDSDESEMLLIKQIVERRKSGSSFNLKLD